MQHDGTWSCLTNNGFWAECDLRGAQPLVEQPGQVVVAQRYSTSGVPCLLPAVFNGFLFFDCVQAAALNGSLIEGCPTQNSNWDVCADQSSNFTAPKLFNATEALNRTGPGPEGSLCPIVPSSNSPNANCNPNLTCVPLPELALNASANGLEGLGFCAEQPPGGTKGIFPYLQEAVPGPSGIEEPLAFFPLTGGSTASLLLPTYNGSLSGAPLPGWVPDPMFGSVVNCSRAAQDAVLLDTVPYAASGPFAVNLWMRRLPGARLNGSYYSYLYSHTGSIIASSGQSPNQVAIYLPNSGHPAYGVVRAIVADASDSGPDLFYLDSDGTVGSDLTKEARPRTPPHADVNDGRWHMITLSTLPNGTKGYALYVDGAWVGELGPGSTTVDGRSVDATGGGPADLTDSIYLCSRSDSDHQRFFDGSVAHLLLFDRALTPQNVAGLYQIYDVNSTGEPTAMAASGPTADPQYASGAASYGLSTPEIAGIVFASLGGFIALLSLGALAVGHYRRETRGKRFERFEDSPAAAAGGGSPAAGLPPQLSIQLSNGKSLSLGSSPEALPPYQSALSDVSTQAASSTASGVPRLPTANSGMPLLPASGSGVGTPPPPSRRTASATTRGGVAIPAAGSPFASAAALGEGGEGGSEGTPSMATAGSNPAGGVTVEAGRRGLFRGSGARVMLPGPPSGADPRSPYEP